MKICINQYAFIATILCATTALYSKHESDASVQTFQLLTDKAQMIEDELNTLVEHYHIIKEQQAHALQYSYKNKNLSAKQHNKIRSLQSSTQKALDDLNGKIQTIRHFLETTLDQIRKTTAIAQSNTTKAMTHFSELSDINNNGR